MKVHFLSDWPMYMSIPESRVPGPVYSEERVIQDCKCHCAMCSYLGDVWRCNCGDL